MPFYTRGRITVFEGCGELEFGRSMDPNPEYFINGKDSFERLLRGDRRVFVVGEIGKMKEIRCGPDLNIYFLARYGDKILFSNKQAVAKTENPLSAD
nr:hypothetical protein [Desulfobacterales bacterium]